MTSYKEAEGRELLKDIWNTKEQVSIAVDTEGTGLRVAGKVDHCIGISIAVELAQRGRKHYFGVNHDSGQNVSESTFRAIKRVLEKDNVYLIFANRPYDVLSLETVDIFTDDQPFIDILTMANICDENRPIKKSLDMLGKFYVDAEKVKDAFIEKEKKTGNHNVTPEQMFEYAAQDAALTYRIWRKLLKHPNWVDLPESIWTDKAETIRVLTAMRREGVRVDLDLTTKLFDEGTSQKFHIRKELNMNPASSVDMKKLFIDELKFPVVKKTPTGEPSFNKAAMEIYEPMLERLDHPAAKAITEYRGWQTATGLLLGPYLELRDPDGRLRANFNTATTRTGRLSCSDPNLQQISKDGGKPWNDRIKKCFIAKDGFTLLSADYSQLELRLIAAYSDETRLKQAFEEGRDVFTEIADTMKFTRGQAKTFVHSVNYGAGVTRLMNVFGVTKQQATNMLENWYRSYPRIRKFNSMCQAKCTRDKKVRLWNGRYRHFLHSDESYKAMNSVIQGGAADLVERVMVRAYNELQSDDCRLLLQVHDALVFEVRSGLVEGYAAEIKDLMEDIDGALRPEEQGLFSVKFNVEVEEW